ncbi:hypothetical protein [Myroides sp. DF42-4-2]|uniref:hypothetical protein n=1 Tax=unclassified Myroides TaxID=2642485 RepID=UPI0025782073|nr:hypothetical protein [Myroides sp. DF42-4-2]MDM1406750.1 hypothetical protein [Myroides sp. DF42-4-2]
MSILSKFTIATEEGLRILFQFREAQLRGMYASKVEEDQFNQYLRQQLDHKETILELNDLSTQMLTVYKDEIPAGYAMIKQVDQPALAENKVINLTSFYLLPDFDQEEVRASLWSKTLSLTRQYDAIWMEVLQDNPLLPHYKAWGFEVVSQLQLPPFDQPAYLLVRWKDTL